MNVLATVELESGRVEETASTGATTAALRAQDAAAERAGCHDGEARQDLQALLGRNDLRQVDREAKGIVKLEGIFPCYGPRPGRS